MVVLNYNKLSKRVKSGIRVYVFKEKSGIANSDSSYRDIRYNKQKSQMVKFGGFFRLV